MLKSLAIIYLIDCSDLCTLCAPRPLTTSVVGMSLAVVSVLLLVGQGLTLRCGAHVIAGRTAGSATQMPDSFWRVLAAAGVTLLSILAALVVPASLGALRVAIFGTANLRLAPPFCYPSSTLVCLLSQRIDVRPFAALQQMMTSVDSLHLPRRLPRLIRAL